MTDMKGSRVSGLYRMSVSERIDVLQEQGWLDEASADALRDGRHLISPSAADKVIENVVGCFALPFAVAPNFIVNEQDYIVPLVVEEPSIVAGLSAAARMAHRTGGFHAHCDESMLAGQVHISDVKDARFALQCLEAEREKLLNAANAVHPRLSERGGGVRDIEFRELELPDEKPGITVTVLVDTCDAMGANLVNTICEAIAPDVAAISGGDVAMRILSNLADRSLVTASVTYPLSILLAKGRSGTELRDAIVLANDIARADVYRATTHNKGIMNGIDPLAIATGNDWRAIEAGAHAYAASSGRYQPLTQWTVSDDGDLHGEICLPLKVGTVGGTLAANPAAEMALAMTGVRSASELAKLMAAVGLAQNFAALRALASSGIQHGHMRLHARSLIAAAGTPAHLFDEASAKLVASGDIKDWKAAEILEELKARERAESKPGASAAGKVILLGEHAVVYGKHALAVPVRDAVYARVELAEGRTSVEVPDWKARVELSADPAADEGAAGAIRCVIEELGVGDRHYRVVIRSSLPRAMGLGSSAAIAVAVVRGFDAALKPGLDDTEVNRIAYECEKLAHGTPSGVDNTVSTYAQPLLFQRKKGLQVRELHPGEPMDLVVASGHQRGLTHEVVAGVRRRSELAGSRYSMIFDEMDALALAGADAMAAGHLVELGQLMNVAHGLLNAIEVSTPELERMVATARRAGAVGAKLTGAGGGGSIVALCPDRQGEVAAALRHAGFDCIELTVS